jgi:hypothetical protein
VGIAPTPTALVDWIDFNYPGVFYTPFNPFGSQNSAELVGQVAQSGQAWHGDMNYATYNQSQGSVSMTANYALTGRVVITAASALKDGAGVQLSLPVTGANSEYTGLVCKDQSSVVEAAYQDTNVGVHYNAGTGSGLVVLPDGIYFVRWNHGEQSGGSPTQEATLLTSWPDASYNFNQGDQMFVVFNEDTVEVRKNNVVTITGFDYVTALAALPSLLTGEAAAIRDSTDFGFTTRGGGVITTSPFIVLP